MEFDPKDNIEYSPAGNPKLQEPRKPDKTKYQLNRKSFLFAAALILIGLSILFRFIGYWGFWHDIDNSTYTHVFLPVLGCFLYMLFVIVFAKKGLWMTSLPVMFVAVFLILETAPISVWWVKAVSILLYVVVATIYTMTVFGKIPTKWLLIISVGIPLIYHLAVQDRSSLIEASQPDELIAWMPEISAMCFIIGLLFIALSMQKVVISYGPKPYDPRAELPQIRQLKYVPDHMEYHSFRKKKGSEPSEDVQALETETSEQRLEGAQEEPQTALPPEAAPSDVPPGKYQEPESNTES